MRRLQRLRRYVWPDGTLDRCTVVVTCLIIVPVAISLIRAGSHTWFPTGDMAQAELHMRGFWRHPPLVGAAGRIGNFMVPFGQGSHPGPAMWVAMLPVYLLLGRTSFALLAAVATVQLEIGRAHV